MTAIVANHYSTDAQAAKTAGSTITIVTFKVSSDIVSSDAEAMTAAWVNLSELKGTNGGVLRGTFTNTGSSAYVIHSVGLTFLYNSIETSFTWGSNSSDGISVAAGSSVVLSYNPQKGYKDLIRYTTSSSSYAEATNSDMAYASPSSDYKIIKPSQIKTMIDAGGGGGGGSYTAGNAISISNNQIGVVTNASTANFNGVVVTHTDAVASPIKSLTSLTEEEAGHEVYYIELATDSEVYTGTTVGFLTKYEGESDTGEITTTLSLKEDEQGTYYGVDLEGWLSHNESWYIDGWMYVMTASQLRSIHSELPSTVTHQCIYIAIKTYQQVLS